MVSYLSLALLAAAAPTVWAACATDNMPRSNSSNSLTEPTYVAPGETYDGLMAKYDRGAGACGSGEGGEADTVFVLEDGATLRNVIIGADQQEGVYCLGECTIENVWFEKVCEDAISVKGDGTAHIIGGGAFGAEDKIIQHNGCGLVEVSDFYAEDYGKVYRSCGNCRNNCAREVSMTGVAAIGGRGEMIGINSNLGDTATYNGCCVEGGEEKLCQDYDGCDKETDAGCEPKKVATTC